MSGNGKGGDSHGKRRRFSRQPKGESRSGSPGGRAPRPEHPVQESRAEKAADKLLAGGRLEKNRGSIHERPRWTAPRLPSGPIPAPDCSWCGKPIKDISAAISDKETGLPIHFDCVIDRLGEGEAMENGDAISYIGGGRFGIIHFNNPPDIRDFRIKKIFEWENKDDRSEWRRSISDHFSVT